MQSYKCSSCGCWTSIFEQFQRHRAQYFGNISLEANLHHGLGWPVCQIPPSLGPSAQWCAHESSPICTPPFSPFLVSLSVMPTQAGEIGTMDHLLDEPHWQTLPFGRASSSLNIILDAFGKLKLEMALSKCRTCTNIRHSYLHTITFYTLWSLLYMSWSLSSFSRTVLNCTSLTLLVLQSFLLAQMRFSDNFLFGVIMFVCYLYFLHF